jgi:hypothetical protein
VCDAAGESAITHELVRFSEQPLRRSPGVFLAPIAAMPIEVVIGRWLAWCSHPVAAWRVLPTSGRALIVASYFVSSYAAVLLALLAFNS